MKKRLAAAAVIVSLLLSGCNAAGNDVIINADGYDGILASNGSTAAVALIPPEISGSEYTSGSPEGESAAFQSEDTAQSERREEENVPTEPENTQASAAASTVSTEITPEPITEYVYAEETSAAAVTETEPTSAAETELTAVTSASASETTTSAAVTAESTTAASAAESETAAETAAPSTGGSGYKALNYSEVKGVWISYLELSFLLTGKTESQFTASIRQAFGNCADMGLNTVYVHVRSHGDAYYKSDYYPWSKYVTGTLGQAPAFDPLKIMVEEAHAAGLSFQAWINPYRLNVTSDMKLVSSDYPTGDWYLSSEGDRIVAEGSYYYLNPGYEEAIGLIAAGVKEILEKYDVDGIHIDDYFYPTTDKSFDSKVFSASGYSSLTSFRTDCCTKMVKALYSAVKASNGTAVFGIAPQGNIQNNYDYMYADVKTWCSGSGYIDYIMPQIYFGFKNSSQPYESVLSEWQDLVGGSGVKLIPGLGVYKIGSEDSYGGSQGRYEWQTDAEIIKRQIVVSESMANYGGFVLYSYAHVFDPDLYASEKTAEMLAVKNYIS